MNIGFEISLATCLYVELWVWNKINSLWYVHMFSIANQFYMTEKWQRLLLHHLMALLQWKMKIDPVPDGCFTPASLSISPGFQFKFGLSASNWQVLVAIQSWKCNFYISGLCRIGWHTPGSRDDAERAGPWYPQQSIPWASQHASAPSLLWLNFSSGMIAHFPDIMWPFRYKHFIFSSKEETPAPFLTVFGFWRCSLLFQFSPNLILISWNLNIKIYS